MAVSNSMRSNEIFEASPVKLTSHRRDECSERSIDDSLITAG